MRVLICEDDSLIQRTLKILIERQGGTVIQAYEGGEAYNAMARKNFDIVIMDIHMPFASGLELIEYLRTGLHLTVPVIVLSALNDAAIREQAFLQGADHFLQKPVDPVSLMDLMTSLANHEGSELS